MVFYLVSLTELCSFWYGLSQRTKLSLTIKTNDVTSDRKDKDLHGWLQQLRGEWVNFILKEAL